MSMTNIAGIQQLCCAKEQKGLVTARHSWHDGTRAIASSYRNRVGESLSCGFGTGMIGDEVFPHALV